MKAERFEDFIVWQRAQELAELAYRCCRSIRDVSFRSQLQRAAVSISNNIAEGYERKGNAEFKHFLFIAKGSSGEVRSMAHLAQRLGHLGAEDSQALLASSEGIARMLSALIKTL